MGLVVLRLTILSPPEKVVAEVVLTGGGPSTKGPGSVSSGSAQRTRVPCPGVEGTTEVGKAEGKGATGNIKVADEGAR